MTRAIEFRAYHPDSGMAFFDLNGIFQEFSFEPTNSCVLFNDGDLRKLNDLEVMQFTGLLDLKGVKIFEGDIVGTAKFPAEVVWHTTGIQWEGIGKYYVSFWAARFRNAGAFDREFYPLEGDNTKIIGNIHEHSHLLGPSS